MNPILTSGLANIINSFTTQFETYFNSNFLTLLSSEVGSYYGVLGAGLMFFLIVNGALFALREKTGKDLQAEIMRCVHLFLILIFGYCIIPAVDFFGETAIEYLYPNRQDAMQVAIDKSDGLGRIEASEYALSENDIRNVKRAQARVSKRNYNGAKIDNASDFNEDNKKESLWSLIKGGLVKLLANICLIVGAFCKLIITFFVLIIKALLRITFPVAVALSFIYGAEKTIGAWWQSYITVTMMSFIIAAIKILQNLLLFDVASNSLSVAQLGIALMAFAFGAAYLCAPTLTVLCVGGSEAAAQLPQQITTSFMTVGAMTWGILKSHSVTSGQFFKETYLKQKKGVSGRYFE